MNLQAWLDGDEHHSFENWKKRLPKIQAAAPPKPSSSTSVQTQQPSTSANLVKKRQRDNARKEKKDLNVPPAQQGSKASRSQLKQSYYVKKYGRAWLDKLFRMDSTTKLEFTKEMSWMKKLIFCTGSIQTRTTTAALLKDLAQTPERRVKVCV